VEDEDGNERDAGGKGNDDNEVVEAGADRRATSEPSGHRP
jgi:hypothetical protein